MCKNKGYVKTLTLMMKLLAIYTDDKILRL